MKKRVSALLAGMMVLCVLLAACSQKAGNATETITIELDSNPSTGYIWTYTVSEEGIVQEVSSDFVSDSDSEELAGAPGKQVFVFRGEAAGEVDLSFTYAREGDTEPEESASYRLTVTKDKLVEITGYSGT